MNDAGQQNASYMQNHQKQSEISQSLMNFLPEIIATATGAGSGAIIVPIIRVRCRGSNQVRQAGCDGCADLSLSFLNGVQFEPRPYGTREADQKRQHHRPTRGAVTEISLGAKQKQIQRIRPDHPGRIDKIGKPRMAGSDKTPEDTQDDEPANEISSPNMQRQKFVLCQIGNGKRKDERPMKDAHQWIPDRNFQYRLFFVHPDLLTALKA